MTIQIAIENPGIIGPGDIVRGKVICTFYYQCNIEGIICRFILEEQTHWSQRRGRHKLHFLEKNIIMEINKNLSFPTNMNPGCYEYNFNFQLPPANIPSSYIHQFGSVRYYIEVLIDEPFGFENRQEVTLNVVAPVVLMNELNVLSLRHQVEEEVGFMCCFSGPIFLDIILERDFYSLGETVNFNVKLINNSNTEVMRLKIQLIRYTEFTVLKPQRQEKLQMDPIILVSRTGVQSKDQKTYNISFNIPKTTFINSFSKCLLFKQWFTLNVTAILPSFYSNLIIEKNLKVGHSIVQSSTETESSTVRNEPTMSYVPVGLSVSSFNFVPVGHAPEELVEPFPPSYDDAVKQRFS